MFPKSIRARAISAYLMVMYGATTSGSCLWGALSAYSVVSTTFIVAAWMLILSPSLHRVGPLNERKVRARRRAAECAR
ncbi:MFS transporter [Sinorhizobium meliloti]|uniref:MFS transporter n=1 Tax=Rhizobium meliloti TaxID=382 RepID=UPI00399B623A